MDLDVRQHFPPPLWTPTSRQPARRRGRDKILASLTGIHHMSLSVIQHIRHLGFIPHMYHLAHVSFAMSLCQNVRHIISCHILSNHLNVMLNHSALTKYKPCHSITNINLHHDTSCQNICRYIMSVDIMSVQVMS